MEPMSTYPWGSNLFFLFWSLSMEPVGVAMGLISCLSVLAIYYWIVRRSQQQAPAKQQ
jgi:hypothetical protein